MASNTMITKRCFDEMFFNLTGFKCDSELIIRLNNKNLSVNGDMYFLTNFKFWKTILGDKLVCHENCTDILQHYAHTRLVELGLHELEQDEPSKTKEKIVELLLLDYDLWDFGTTKFTLQKERVCLFLDRRLIVKKLLMEVFKKESRFGVLSNELAGELTIVVSYEDIMQDITTSRLSMIKDACLNILSLHGYDTEIKRGIHYIVLTSKSKVEPSKKYDMYVCGAVKNPQTNTREKTLTMADYINAKIKALTKLNEQKCTHEDEPDVFVKLRIEKMAEDAAKFELLSVKPSRPVFMNLNTDTSKVLTNTKGIPFIFYNIVRIKSIMEYFRIGVKKRVFNFPGCDTNFDCDYFNEEEWELIYYFTLGYLEAVKNSFTLKPTLKLSPHIICTFLSQLSHKFSVYYSRNKILVNQSNVQLQLFARVCMLDALQVVLSNGLRILDIKPVNHM